ncbi:MAG TPA: T9SS type A sorting domain-containing protein [Patescibacteria group bacterium]|nr:T9SS type A sorting domain-containing protein [Patescibacteria group bacterium]
MATAPVYQGGDVLAETGTEVSNVRTYALWFENANSANHSIANIELQMPDGTQLLAFGSGLTNNQKLDATASFNSDGTKKASYLIPVFSADRQHSPIEPGESVGPIYITVSGAENGFELGFTTTDENGVIITNGSVWLENPVYQVNSNGEESEVSGVSSEDPGSAERGPSLNSAIMLNVYPNPAGNSATVNLGLENSEILSVVVIDGQGKEVTKVLTENTLQTGNHLFNLNTSALVNGTYYIMAKTRDGRIMTSQLKVVK